MLEKLKTTDKNQKKRNVIYALLLITNIILFAGLFNYYSKMGINFNFESFEDISAVIATIIILGYISVQLPKIREIGESPFYGMIYLTIICAIGLVTSYFNGKVNTATLFGPYLDMFKVLCAVLIFILLATNLKSFKNILHGEHTRKDQIICLIIFALIGLFASYVHVTIKGTPANIRCLIVMISGLVGGPFVGIPVGIISGAYRFTLGGVTAVPCSISTVISGIIGSLIYLWNGKKFPRTLEAILLMFLFTGFEMFFIVMVTPPDISFPYIGNIYPLMLFASVIGMLLFSIVVIEQKKKRNPQPSYEEQKIKEFEDKFELHDANHEDLKNEVAKLKKEIEELKGKME